MSHDTLDMLLNQDETIVSTLREQYNEHAPIQYVHLHNFFSNEDATHILNEWPDLSDNRWTIHMKMVENNVGKKFEIANIDLMGKETQRIIQKIQSPEFISAISKITGVAGLQSDAGLYGGGLVYTPQGGYLKLHADFNFYDKSKLYRRFNLIVYMNEQWEENWKGGLELWNADCTQRIITIQPFYNTAIFFRVTDKSIHGYPDPIACPPTTGRKSINFYFYHEKPDDDQSVEPHKTLWKE